MYAQGAVFREQRKIVARRRHFADLQRVVFDGNGCFGTCPAYSAEFQETAGQGCSMRYSSRAEPNAAVTRGAQLAGAFQPLPSHQLLARFWKVVLRGPQGDSANTMRPCQPPQRAAFGCRSRKWIPLMPRNARSCEAKAIISSIRAAGACSMPSVRFGRPYTAIAIRTSCKQ